MVGGIVTGPKDEPFRRERAMNGADGAMLLFVHFGDLIADLSGPNSPTAGRLPGAAKLSVPANFNGASGCNSGRVEIGPVFA
jgi:hypothetical protein